MQPRYELISDLITSDRHRLITSDCKNAMVHLFYTGICLPQIMIPLSNLLIHWSFLPLVLQGYSNDVFWDKLSTHIAPISDKFEAGRLVSVIKYLPLGTRPLGSTEASRSTEEDDDDGLLAISKRVRGDLIAASSSSLAARADQIPASLIVDLAQTLSIMPAWARERVDPVLMSNLPKLATSVMTGESEIVSHSTTPSAEAVRPIGVGGVTPKHVVGGVTPKHVVLLASAIGRLHAGALPGGVKEAVEAWVVSKHLPGFELKHVVGMAQALEAAGSNRADVRQALESQAVALLHRTREAGETIKPWLHDSLSKVFGDKLHLEGMKSLDCISM